MADREEATKLLGHLKLMIEKNEEAHPVVGSIAAKYLEAIQRGNDQLIKIITVLSKDLSEEEDENISPDDIYKAINEKSDEPIEVYIPTDKDLPPSDS